jgi:hypothetical protein
VSNDPRIRPVVVQHMTAGLENAHNDGTLVNALDHATTHTYDFNGRFRDIVKEDAFR